MNSNIHLDQPVLTLGADYQDAGAVVILLHGRGARAESMIPLAEELQIRGLRFLIPQAGKKRWYPQSAFGPLEPNQPDLDSALGAVEGLINQARQAGFSEQQIVLGGFSQGACLAAEFAVRNPSRYGGVFIFSGGLIGPPGEPRNLTGSFDSMPVFIGGSDLDPWISFEVLKNAENAFEDLNAMVTFKIYPGMPHTVNQDEIEQVKKIMQTVRK